MAEAKASTLQRIGLVIGCPLRNESYLGVRVRVWVMVRATAALVKGMGNVVPWYQTGHWFRNQVLAGLPDWPRTMFKVL